MTAPPTTLTLRFPPPGFFLADARTIVRLDGTVIYDGSFKSGFEVTVPLSPGPHTLDTVIAMGRLQRTRQYPLTIEPGQSVRAELVYSRFWGNFKKQLKRS